MRRVGEIEHKAKNTSLDEITDTIIRLQILQFLIA